MTHPTCKHGTLGKRARNERERERARARERERERESKRDALFGLAGACVWRGWPQSKKSYFTEMCSASGKGSYVRLIDLCITQL